MCLIVQWKSYTQFEPKRKKLKKNGIGPNIGPNLSLCDQRRKQPDNLVILCPWKYFRQLYGNSFASYMEICSPVIWKYFRQFQRNE